MDFSKSIDRFPLLLPARPNGLRPPGISSAGNGPLH
jgi:hypothetical protein